MPRDRVKRALVFHTSRTLRPGHEAGAPALSRARLLYASRCSDGTELVSSTLSRFGTAGEFTRSCDPAVTVASTDNGYPDGPGARSIPDRACAERDVLVAPGRSTSPFALYETWSSQNALTTEAGQPLVDYPGNPAGAAVEARTTVELEPVRMGSEVVLVFRGGDPRSPIILGCVIEPSRPARTSQGAACAPSPPACQCCATRPGGTCSPRVVSARAAARWSRRLTPSGVSRRSASASRSWVKCSPVTIWAASSKALLCASVNHGGQLSTTSETGNFNSLLAVSRILPKYMAIN